MKGQREFSRKPCPKCGVNIGISWSEHFSCGWKADKAGEGVSLPTFPKPSSDTLTLMMESKEEVMKLFNLNENEFFNLIMKAESLARVMDTIFIEKCKRERE